MAQSLGLRSRESDRALLEHYAFVAQVFHGRGVVADEQNCSAALSRLADSTQALFLKLGIADRENFVDDKDIGLEVGGTAKAKRTRIPLE